MNADTVTPSLSSAYILPLIEAHREARVVGAKAARLSALLQKGEPVPDGFCVIGTGEAALARAREAYRLLGTDTMVAVRSSASAEDDSETSFAGQFETVLNVRGEQALAAALERCWASVFGERAEAYRAHSGRADAGPIHMAALIQRMVQARAAGVAFSANPLTGARDEVVIEAVSGLGDILVSGEVTPDRFTVGARGDIQVQTASVMEPALNENQAREIMRLIRRIEADAGVPQDIEWAFDDTSLWLLQARPITALPEAVEWISPIPSAKWMKDLMAGEWVTEPLSPLGATTTLETMAVAREQWSAWPPLPKVQAPGHTLINGWLYMRADGRPLTLIANILTSMLSILTGTMSGHRRVRRLWPQRIMSLDTLEKVDLSSLPDSGLQTHIAQLLHSLGAWWMEVAFFRSFARVGEQILDQFHIPGLTQAGALFRGNKSLLLEAERSLRRVARNETSAEDHLARFGHFVESADPIHPTLRESPDHLAWQIEAARLSKQDPDERLAVIRRERAAAEAAIKRLGGFRGYFARQLLAAGQSHAAHTDDAVFHFQRALAGLRAAFLEKGRRLIKAGVLDAVDDVFYLEGNELWPKTNIPDIRARVAERRASREQQRHLAPPPFIPPVSDPAWTDDPNLKRMPASLRAAMLERGVAQRDGRRVLVGTPGSPGRTRGIARVVTSTADFARFQSGDILVAHATSPIWTPLFGIAAGAVTEVGGPFAHAAIVAREFGIPLVDGALDATRLIADGTPVVIDGSVGIVEF